MDYQALLSIYTHGNTTILFHFPSFFDTDFLAFGLTGFSKISSSLIDLSDSTFRKRAGTHPEQLLRLQA
jgi:hypothetical protein